MATKQEETKGLTRAQKTAATKAIIKELLAIKPTRHNELIEEAAKLYTVRHEGEGTENVNDVKGRIGSVLDAMKKESAVMYDGGMYALKARLPMPPPEEKLERSEEKTEAKTEERSEEKPVKKATRTRAKKAQPIAEEVKTEETPVKKTRARGKKAAVKSEEVATETPAPVEEKTEDPKPVEAPAPKKRGRKPKAEKVVATETAKEETKEAPVEAPKSAPKEEAPVEVKAEEKTVVEEKAAPVEENAEAPASPEEVKEEKAEKKPQEAKNELVVKPVAAVAKKNVVMDMSFLLGDKPQKAEKKPLPEEKTPVKTEEKPVRKDPVKTEEKPVQKTVKVEEKPAEKAESRPVRKAEAKPAKARPARGSARQAEKPMTADEKLRDAFIKKMYTLGGDYFEYYSVYLLEKYSRRNGRRLEGLRISGGDHDGGIDGEIELTDKLGFKETIYIQSKNWNPEKGKEENWVVGETLLQQFIGACVCRQAKDGKQNARGIFITTSRFTPDAKRILEDMSDKIVGYDGNDLFEAAKECEFGVIKRNGEWVLDEKLLSGTKAFFNML